MLARDVRSFAAIAGGHDQSAVIQKSSNHRIEVDARCSAASASPTDRMPRVMALAEHTTKAFDYDLQDLARMIAEMGGLAERQIVEVIEALTRRDLERARRSVAADAAIDSLQRSIEERAIETIARRQPMAIDLRGVVGVLRISNDLERIGDLAKNIGKRVIALEGGDIARRSMRGVRHMANLALIQLRDALDSFARQDLAKAATVKARDEEVDRMYTSLFRELLTYMMEDPGTIASGLHLLFCSKNIERMGDHTTNIAESVQYIIAGYALPSERARSVVSGML
jgi:phosphate transport system protein